MLVEVVLDNKERFLLGGSFAYMTLQVAGSSATQVPVGALITRGNDQFVAVVGPDSRLHYIKVAVASTDGDTVTLAGGNLPEPQNIVLDAQVLRCVPRPEPHYGFPYEAALHFVRLDARDRRRLQGYLNSL